MKILDSEYFDAVVVGAGFSGLSCLHELRKQGFRCKVFEAGSGLGGVWTSNCYPGARTDTSYFVYQLHHEDVGQSFEWTERFPSWEELQAYFRHVDQEHNFSQNIQFNTRVSSANFSSTTNQWTVRTSDSVQTVCRYLFLCTGVAAKPYYPKFPGMDKFQGQCFHTGDWTKDRTVDFKNKRVAVFGTGASGVQIIQEVGPIASHLTVLQRTPNLAIPMQQKHRGDDWEFPGPSDYARIRSVFAKTHGGLRMVPHGTNCVDVSEEERAQFFEKLYTQGGFSFWRWNYQDVLQRADANKYAYEFWQKKTAARIEDPVKRELLAPTRAPHPFGTKRPSLEQTYYEVYNQPNVDLVNLRQNPVKEIKTHGILLQNGQELDVDIIVLATGFDAVTGTIYEIDIVNESGQRLKDCWKNGIRTLLGIATGNFPNMFFVNGPQGTAALSVGPASSKTQSDWLVDLLVWMREHGKERIEPKEAAIEEWTAHVHEVWDNSLFPLADSWWVGANIPGKKREPLTYAGGNPTYVEKLGEAKANEYSKFNFL